MVVYLLNFLFESSVFKELHEFVPENYCIFHASLLFATVNPTVVNPRTPFLKTLCIEFCHSCGVKFIEDELNLIHECVFLFSPNMTEK